MERLLENALRAHFQTNFGRFTESASRLAGFAGAALGWSPDAFWCATPAELAAVVTALTGGEDAAAPPSPETLKTLMEAFPDG